jgi:uncharacterized integral membrane protein
MLIIVKRLLQLVTLLVFISLIAAFTVYNTHEVLFSLPILGYSTQIPLYVMVGVVSLGAIFITSLYFTASYTKRSLAARHYIKKLERENDGLTKELRTYQAEAEGKNAIRQLLK